LFIATLVCCLQVGCTKDKSLVTGETKSLKWFMEHPDEREEALAICREDNWALKGLPNCDNAIGAETVIRSNRKEKIKPIQW
jgi:hypothetical protein